MDAPSSRSKQVAAAQHDGDGLAVEAHPHSTEAGRITFPGAVSPTLRPAASHPLRSGIEQRLQRSSWPASRTESAPRSLADEPNERVTLTSLLPGLNPLAANHAPGSTIVGKYKLEREIGSGGMGSVWCARNLALDIDVAIKLIRRDRTTVEAKMRLLQEARAAARLGHPSIVRIFDFGETAEGDPFIVMELLDGEPLSSLLARMRALPPPVAVRTLLPVASALVAAHAKGTVHRDLKPDNILLVKNEVGAVVPKIVDFGIARLVGADTDPRFTLSGEVLGSPEYMSPEQARGEENIGETTDVWAFTVILYEALTGRRPFDGENYNTLITHIMTTEPMGLMQLGIDDEELSFIVTRGLAKDAVARWRTMREMGKALATWSLARGFGDDVAGTALAKHWLSGSRRRTLSVRPPTALLAPLLQAPAPPPPAELERMSRVSAPVASARQLQPGSTLTTSSRSGELTRTASSRAGARWQTAFAVVFVVLVGILGRALLNRAPATPTSGVLAVAADEATGTSHPNLRPVPEILSQPAQPPPTEDAARDVAPGGAGEGNSTAPATSVASKTRQNNPAKPRTRPRSMPAPPLVPRRAP